MKKIETDVVVVAAGLSGLAAAATAAECGARVVAFEKSSAVGGAASMGLGPFAVGTKHQRSQLIDIDVERAFKMFMEYTHWRVDANLVRRYFENSADTIVWLEDMGVEFAGAFRYFPKAEATWHIVAGDKGTPGRNGGANMTKAMLEYAKACGVEFYLETPAVSIQKDGDGAVCGVIARGADGEEIEASCKAAVICTGGAGDNPQMIKERMGYTFQEDMFNFAIPGLKGDGISMAYEAGAMQTAMSIEMIYVLPNCFMVAENVQAVLKQPNLIVNQNGARFIDEEQVQNTTFTGNAISIQRGSAGYPILDTSILRGYIRNGPDVGNAVQSEESVEDFDEVISQMIEQGNPDVFKADSIRELAKMLGIDPDALETTVDEYNGMCVTGDTKFFKRRKYMKPIVRAPFYAGKFRPGGYGTLGGIKINEYAEVLDKSWKPIPGLFAAGTDTCSIYGDSYMFLLPGNTMGYCLNTGRFAGESAAQFAAVT